MCTKPVLVEKQEQGRKFEEEVARKSCKQPPVQSMPVLAQEKAAVPSVTRKIENDTLRDL